MYEPGNQIEIPLNLAIDQSGYSAPLPSHSTPPVSPSNLLDNPMDSNNLAILNPEIFIVAFLLLALPICIYLAYRYGKKTGRKENVPASFKYFGPGAIKRRPSLDSTSGNSFQRQISNNSRDSSTSSSPTINHSLSPPDSLIKESPLSIPMSTGKNKRESSVQTEDEKIEEFALNEKVDSKNSQNGQLVPVQDKVDSLDNIENFKIVYANSCGVDDTENEIDTDLFQEKLLLHSQDGQVLKREVQYGVVFRKEGKFFQKREIKELTTIYAEGVESPENNAKMLKHTYQLQHNGLVGQKLFGNIKKAASGKSEKNRLLAIAAEEPLCLDISNSVAQGRVTRKCSETEPKRSNSFNEIKVEEKANSMTEAKIETVVEKYGVPDETGKFNKIFKDVEWIGEGSFGEVYKVVHRLDGKRYAVKKVKLRLGRFEELKSESKVFREVFAMTDLHHPNIVRYSTCWVELEWDKEVKEAKEKVDQALNLGDISENEVSDEDVSDDESEPAERSKTSDLGFDWESSRGSIEKTKKKEVKKDKKKDKLIKRPNEKRLPKLRARKSCLSIKTLSRSFIEEELDENSKNSSVSRVESMGEIPGCKLYLYIQMEYCAGQSLKYYLENPQRKIVREKVLEMFRKLLEGVNSIHSRGILHRDLKPANIFLDGNENVKIGDFGLASLDTFEESHEGLTPKEIANRKGSLHSSKVGTPMYTSPEQECGGNYDQKTDIYSLGLIFYEMLMNFVTNHERYQHFSKVRFEHELPTVFKKTFAAESEIILKMTEKSPENRPTAEELIAYVNKLLDKYKSQSSQN